MNKVEPNRNVYIGHRYVPLLVGEWDKSIQYEGLSIVTFKGGSYTSKKMTPPGIDIENEEYWVLTGNYDAQVEYYRQETKRVSDDLAQAKIDLNKRMDDTVEYVDTNVEDLTIYVNDEVQQTKEYVDDEVRKNKEYVDDEVEELNIKKADIEYVDDSLSGKTDLIESRIDYYIPDDFNSLQEAINYIQKKHSMGSRVGITIRSGHKPRLRTNIRDSYLPNVSLYSEDDIVEISDTLSDNTHLLDFANTYGFMINCLIDMGGIGNHGIYVQSGSYVFIGSGCGVINAGGDGLHVRHGGNANAQYTNFTGSGKNITGSEERAGISSWGGTVSAHGSDVSGGAHHGVRSAHGGSLDFDNGTANNCGLHGIRAAQGGRLTCREAESMYNGSHGIYALNSSYINADRSNASHNNSVGYRAVGGSIIHANQGNADECRIGAEAGRGSTVNFFSGSALNCETHGLYANHSSTIEARNIEIQGSQTRGVLAEENSSINIQNSLVYGSRVHGIEATGNSNVNAAVSIVRNTQPGNEYARGVFADGLSRINVSGSQVWNNGTQDLRVDKGGQIMARGVTTSSGALSGEDNIESPQPEDVNIPEFNRVRREGVIFN